MSIENNAPSVTQPTQQPPRKKSNAFGVTGFVLAVLSFPFSLVPVLGILLSLLATIFSAIGLIQSGKRNAGKGLSIAGLAIGIIFLVVSISYSVYGHTVTPPADNSVNPGVAMPKPSSYKQSILAEVMDLTETQEKDMLAIFESCGIVELKEVTQFQAGDEHTSYYINDDETEHYAGADNTIVVWVHNDTKTVESIYFHDHDIYSNETVVAQVSDYYVSSSLRDEYRVTAQLLVKQCLNYPDTAKFGSRSAWSFGVNENGNDVVQSSVTAKNAFGMESTEDFQILYDRNTGVPVSLILGGIEYIK